MPSNIDMKSVGWKAWKISLRLKCQQFRDSYVLGKNYSIKNGELIISFGRC